jgi:hypothetical protein
VYGFHPYLIHDYPDSSEVDGDDDDDNNKGKVKVDLSPCFFFKPNATP